jgi:hypothetical protein
MSQGAVVAHRDIIFSQSSSIITTIPEIFSIPIVVAILSFAVIPLLHVVVYFSVRTLVTFSFVLHIPIVVVFVLLAV